MPLHTDFDTHLSRAASFFQEHFRPRQPVAIVHHNDADGLSSAVLLAEAVRKLGGEIRRFCLEKPYPAAIEAVHARSPGLIVYVDFGGRSAAEIARINQRRHPVLILDHHAPETTADDTVCNINPIFAGLRGDRDLSAAGVAYLFCQTLDDSNRELVHLALIGAIGDSQDHTGQLDGYNLRLFEQAEAAGTLQPQGSACRNAVLTGFKGHQDNAPVTLAEISRDATTLGAVGYLSGGIHLGMQLLTAGYNEKIAEALHQLTELKNQRFAAMEQRLAAGHLHKTNHIQWFDVKDSFYPLGVKMVGVFCSSIRDKAWIDGDKYIAGFQYIPDHIPDLGEIPIDSTKISMRMPEPLQKKMFAGQAQTLLEILPPATTALGGFVDGCHSYSAATTVAKGQEKALVAEMEKRIQP